MPLVNYTLDTEVDVSGTLTVAANTITSNSTQRQDDTYEYLDMGAGNSGDFEHLFEAQLDSTSDSSAIAAGHLLGNDIGSITEQDVAGGHHIELQIRNGAGILQLVLEEFYSGSEYQDPSTALSLDTLYYYALKYVDSTKVLTCKTYSDSGRTTLVDTLTLTLHAAFVWQYRYSWCSFGSAGSTMKWDGTVSNTDLQLPAVGAVPLVSGGLINTGLINGRLVN